MYQDQLDIGPLLFLTKEAGEFSVPYQKILVTTTIHSLLFSSLNFAEAPFTFSFEGCRDLVLYDLA